MLRAADESDLRIVCRIIEAAIWYTIVERVELQPGSEPASQLAGSLSNLK